MKAFAAILTPVALAGLLALVWMALRGAPSGPVIAGDIVAGARLYGENCATCHGARLEGQPDWRTPNPDGRLPAPPHDETGHTWHHGDGVLLDYTKLGGAAALARQGVEFASGMPAFGDRLDDRQIRDILAYVKSTWPERERQVQAARTEAEALEGNARR